ncbi:unnamed protein product [Paramecium pentaurelia]|uniref:WD domain, G-beta repeat protein n=1 Tax=Paramecium pentaurelia TaxID=43138 RepID=A0A8S1SZY4_9CILI|nr:unnamed protein product [Paramecium pentaurelia]
MNNSCSEQRLFCFICVKNNLHSTYQRDWEKMSSLKEKFLLPQSKDRLEIVDSLEMLQQQINRFVNKLKEILKEKFVLSPEKLREMSANKMNDFLSILFQCQIEKQAILLDIILQNTQNLIESLNNLIKDNQQQLNESIILDQKAHTIDINQFNDHTIQINQQNDSTININKNNMINMNLQKLMNKRNIQLFVSIKILHQWQLVIKTITLKYFNLNQEISNKFMYLQNINLMYFVYNLQKLKFHLCLVVQTNDNHKLWYILQRLSGHEEEISCLLLNNNDDLIITGSADKRIRFWIKDKSWKHSFTLNQHKGYIISICLNESQNLLISFALDDNQILVSKNKYIKNGQLFKQQKREHKDYVLLIIIYLLFKRSQLNRWYFMNQINNKVKVKSGNQCECLFPQQYIPQKQIQQARMDKILILQK